MRRMLSRGPGLAASAFCSASARIRGSAGLVRYNKAAADRMHAPGPRSARYTAQPCSVPTRSAPAGRYAALAEALGVRPADHFPASDPHCGRRPPLAQGNNSPRNHHRKATDPGGSNSVAARWCTIWCGLRQSHSMSSSGEELAARPIAQEHRAHGGAIRAVRFQNII